MSGKVGRPKGSKSKYTKLKDILLDAVRDLGGKKWILETAKSDPVAFLKIVASLLPKEVTGEGGGPIRVTWESGPDDDDHDPV